MDHQALADRYARVKSTIPAHVTLIAVSKTRTVEEIQALHDLGHRDFGENYPQEMRDKHPLLPPDIRWHFIGHLQTNKVKYIAPFVHLVHTVDGPKVLDELQKRAFAADRSIQVLVQVHIAQEETKHGLDPEEARSLISNWDPLRWSRVDVQGLMGMATNTADEVRVKSEFDGLSDLFRSLRGSKAVDPGRFTLLSMGMSSDAPLAIAAGSTMVRIGTALFGERG